jgi:hypothetical protein
MMRVEHVARMGGVYRVWVRRPEGKNRFENPSLDGRIILKWIFKK